MYKTRKYIQTSKNFVIDGIVKVVIYVQKTEELNNDKKSLNALTIENIITFYPKQKQTHVQHVSYSQSALSLPHMPA
jgi:hypothetical protein